MLSGAFGPGQEAGGVGKRSQREELGLRFWVMFVYVPLSELWVGERISTIREVVTRPSFGRRN